MDVEVIGMPDFLRGMSIEAEGAPPLDDATARQLLTDSYAKLMERHDLKPGQIIRRKRGLEPGTKAARGGIAIFISYDTPGYWDSLERGHPVSQADVDCTIGEITRDGAMVEYLACSRYYEPAE